MYSSYMFDTQQLHVHVVFFFHTFQECVVVAAQTLLKVVKITMVHLVHSVEPLQV